MKCITETEESDGQACPRWSMCVNYSAEEALLLWAAVAVC